MAKCVCCEKRGLFLKVNQSGICVNCEKVAALEKERRAVEEQRARLAEPIAPRWIESQHIENVAPLVSESQPLKQKDANIIIKMPNVSGFELKYSYDDVIIAGSQYYNTQSVHLGVIVDLEAEPDNEHDPKAVAVLLRGDKLGYVPRGKLQDMVHDFRARDEAALARISYIGSDGLKMAVGFYIGVESEFSKLKKSGIKYKSYKLTGNRNEEMQDNIFFCSKGNEVFYDYDFDKEKYLASDVGEIGYFPKSAEKLLDENHKAFIEHISEDENGKYSVTVAVFTANE